MTIRDPELRSQVIKLIEASGFKLTMSEILRTALIEYLEKSIASGEIHRTTKIDMAKFNSATEKDRS